jgi:hypothetical protein
VYVTDGKYRGMVTKVNQAAIFLILMEIDKPVVLTVEIQENGRIPYL